MTAVSYQTQIVGLTPQWVDAAAGLFHDAWHETQAVLQHPCIVLQRDLPFFRNRVVTRIETSLVARKGNHCEGYVAWEDARLASLFVARSARNRGLGNILCAAAEARMKVAGHRHIWLDCICGNDAARRFYERNGWSVESVIAWPVECSDVNAEVLAWRMIKTLSPD